MDPTLVKRTGALVSIAAILFAGCGTSATPAPTAAPTTGASVAPTEAPSTAPEPVTLTYLIDDTQTTGDRINGIVAIYEAKHPNVTINVETRPGGTDGDNVVKTRLATGTMDDMFFYNSGSLLQALKPADTLVDLSAEPFIKNIQESYLPTVSAGTGIYGVPSEPALGGGILYNKKVFAAAGVTVPKTWAEFESNNEKIKATGVAPVGATFGDTWTSQLFILADYYNVQVALPDFAKKYTANQEKYATEPAALNGFKELEEAYKKGWFQKDFASAKYDDGLGLLATGKIAQYPMLTFALSTIAANYPANVNDIGFFGQPGTDAAKAGATIWMPAATYIPKTSKNIAAAKDFLAFLASVDGTKAMTAASVPSGPYVIKGSSLPDNVLPAVKDIQAYTDSGNVSPALEFLSPIKGPSLEQITVAVGSGLSTAEEGAALYDQDVVKQAKQLGLPGW